MFSRQKTSQYNQQYTYNLLIIYTLVIPFSASKSSTSLGGPVFLLFLCWTENLIIQWALENVLIEICHEFNIYYSGIGAS